MSYRGSVDALSSEGATGWIFSADVSSRGETVVVQALLDGRIIGETQADMHRHDLAAAGFGDGRCGFSMTFYDVIDPLHLPFVSIRPQGSDLELPRTNLTGFSDFFRAVHARHPTAGRNRCVLGGLWTDRTDAALLLATRSEAGLVSHEIVEPLSGLIASGFSVIKGAVGQDGAMLAHLISDVPSGAPVESHAGEAQRQVLATLCEGVFPGVTSRVLRGAFDDAPICYRVVVERDTGDFAQPSSAIPMPSPAECAVLVVPTGQGRVLLDVVRDSHTLPEFTADGRSRWSQQDASAAVSVAIAHGACVDTVELGPTDAAVVGPGTIMRVRVAGGAALVAWCAPKRVMPLSLLAANSDAFAVDADSIDAKVA